MKVDIKKYHIQNNQPNQTMQLNQPMYPSQDMYMNTTNTTFKPTFDPSFEPNTIQIKDTGILFVISVIIFSTPIQDIVCKFIPSVCSTGVSVNMGGIILLSFLISLFFSTYKLYG